MNTKGTAPAGTEKPIGLALRFPLASLLVALRFLTIIPVSWKSEGENRFFQASLIWFPPVGLLIGAGTALPVSLCIQHLPSSITAVLVMVFLAGFSGCLHLDGLADSGDALLSARSRERALEIMRDSRSGPMGTVSLVVVLLGKYAALSSLSPSVLIISVLLIPLAGRTAILLSMILLPYARKEEGLGLLFYSKEKYGTAAAGIFFSFLFIILFTSFPIALSALLAIVVTAGLFSYWCFNKLGGATGDTLGAVCELTEMTVAVSLAVATYTG